jgi:protein subunit release factor B
MIGPGKWEQLRKEMEALGIEEASVAEHFIRGSGRGGQKMNKTSSCVQLIYGELEVRCQKTRSQADNRFWARRELCERVRERREGAFSKRQQEMERIRRQKRRRSRRAKARMLEGKARRGEQKRLRGRVDPPNQS